MTNPAYIDTAAIKSTYAPYHTMPAFQFGYDCYALNIYKSGFTGVAAQAFDRGLDCAARVARAQHWIEQNVGAN